MGNLSAFAFVCLCAGAALACGGGDDNGGATSGGGSGGTGGATGGTGATGGVSGSGGSTGGTGGAECNEGPGYATNDPKHAVNSFNAKVLDLDGKPAADMLAQVCGTDICINAETDANGAVVTCNKQTNTCTAGIQPSEESKLITRPAFKYGDGRGFAKFAYLLPTDTSDYDIGTHTTAALPALGSGEALAPGGTAQSNGIVLTLPASGIEIDELVFMSPDEQKFRAVEIPIAKAPAAADPALGFEMLVATTPIETHFCAERAKLTVPNTPGWPAGTEVEFWYHGIDPGEGWAPYAGWAKMSGGAVSADGKTVSTSDAEGIGELSIFGIKKK